jgi:hypothetical protein
LTAVSSSPTCCPWQAHLAVRACHCRRPCAVCA